MQTSKKESRDYLFNTINDALYHVIHSCRIYILQTTEQTEKAEQVILSCLICISSNVRIYRRIYFVYQSIYLLPLLISESKSIHCNEFNIIHSLFCVFHLSFSLCFTDLITRFDLQKNIITSFPNRPQKNDFSLPFSFPIQVILRKHISFL